MKVYISVDLEGVAGISDWEQCIAGGDDYEMGRELALGEVNAAIDGAMQAGATEILVNDSHSFMRNLPPGELHGHRVVPLGTVQAAVHDGGSRRVVRRRVVHRLPRGDADAGRPVPHLQPAGDHQRPAQQRDDRRGRHQTRSSPATTAYPWR